VDSLRVDLQEYGGGLRGHVRVFANTTAVIDFLPEILSGFLSANPRVNVDLQENRTQKSQAACWTVGPTSASCQAR